MGGLAPQAQRLRSRERGRPLKTLGETPRIDPEARVKNTTFGRYCEVMAGASLLEVEMGDYSYCARGADIFCTTIGKFSNIAAATRINPGNHPMERASLHHFQYRSAMYWPEAEDDGAFFDWRRSHRCFIGHDTWLGHGAIVLPGRCIGTGAVVGAGAVVTKDVAPYAIVAGNPARTIRQRFASEIAERLQVLAWWDWDHAAIGEALANFRTLPVEAFLEKHGA
ncbi:MAG: chloramphenicol acetyltransferase [Pseudomonadota bacterium]